MGKKMEGYCSTGQSLQWAVVPEEKEEEEEEEDDDDDDDSRLCAVSVFRVAKLLACLSSH
jgi:hypothetical protein